MMLGSGKEIWHFMRVFRSAESLAFVSRRVSRHVMDVVRHGRGMNLTNGNALAGRLAKAAMDLKIPVWLCSPARNLLVEDSAVVGAVVDREGKPVTVRAARGVVLACGGFPHDIERRRALFPHAPTGREHFSPSPAANVGDGLRMAESVGGHVDATIPNAAAWVPTSVTRRKDGSHGVMPHFIDRAKPGVIAVNAQARRFTNEADSYHDFVQAMVADCRGRPEVAAWLLCNHRTLRQYGLGCVAPFPMPTAMIMFVMIGATVFSVIFRKLGGDIMIANALGIDDGADPYRVMFVIMAFVFVLGMFLDWVEVTFIVIPIIAPIVAELDFGLPKEQVLLWFAILFAVNLQTSFLTPPFGYALFYIRGIAPPEISTRMIYQGIVPFVVIQLVALLLTVIFPQVALWLPDALLGP